MPSCSLEHHRKLPGDGVGVLYARVAAEASCRWHRVSSVPGDEDPPSLERFGRLGDSTPLVDVEHVHLEVPVSHRIAHQLSCHLAGDGVSDEPRPRFVDVADGEHNQEPAKARLLEPEEATHIGVVHVDHAEVAAAQRHRAVGRK